MQMKRIDRIQYLEVIFAENDQTVQGFTTRHEGVSRTPYNSLNLGTNTLDQHYNVEGNRNLMARTFDVSPYNLLTVKQVHGDDILVIDQENSDLSHFLSIEADAIITNQKGIMIGVCVADCVPILLFDPVKNIIAVVHAGWQGTVKRLAAKTVAGMQSIFGCKNENILVAIGPSIGKCCYEVDAPVKKAFENSHLPWETYSHQSEGAHWQLDLAAANLEILITAGVLESQIQSADSCVSCQRELFFSYRRDGGETGRQMGFIMLKGK